jgi:uncharacterized cupin superfamily protein
LTVPPARKVETPDGVMVEGDGWYVLNARDARWRRRDTFGRVCILEPEPVGEVFADHGFHIAVLQPGEANGRYHRESVAEDFLVVHGECVLLIEEEEHRLSQWDFVHCPPEANHIFVGAGDGPCVVVMSSARHPDETIVYPVSELASARGVGVEAETDDPTEAYAAFERRIGRYREGDLPTA